jgi:hypothetical protein
MIMPDLTTLVGPPVQPSDRGTTEQWAQIEAELGVILPPDYKAYVSIYGSGCFDDFIIFFNPFSPSPHDNLLHQLHQHHEAERVRRLNFPNRIEAIVHPFSLFPAANGLLPFGRTTNFGDTFFWQVQGQPSAWPLVLYNLRDGEYEVFQTSCTAFLVGVFSKAIVPRLFPEDFPGDEVVTFEAW